MTHNTPSQATLTPRQLLIAMITLLAILAATLVLPILIIAEAAEILVGVEPRVLGTKNE